MSTRIFKKENPGYISITEASTISGVSPGKIRKLVKLGIIASKVKYGVFVSYHIIEIKDLDLIKSYKNKRLSLWQ